MYHTKRGIVASGHQLTSQAAIRLLEEGGNAFDAAIGALLMACVAENACISLGGGGFLLAYSANQSASLYDFFVHTPNQKRKDRPIDFYPLCVDYGDGGTTQDFYVGMGAMAVPGIVAGLFQVHQDLGSLPFKIIAEPAIETAKTAIALDAFQVMELSMLDKIVTHQAESRAIYTDAQGQIKKIGEEVLVPYLADTIDHISREGKRAFYEGEIAQRLVKDQYEKGGFITLADLKNYQAVKRQALSIDYRNHTLLMNTPPSAGGTLSAFSLKLLEEKSLSTLRWGSAKHLTALSDAMRLTNTARKKSFDAYLPQIAKQFLNEQHLNAYLEKMNQKAMSTTQISVLDTKGNAASVTISAGTGSGYFIPQTGIMMNNMLGEEDLHPNGFHQWTPNQRLSSMMSPTIILKDEQPCLVLGSSGSNRIRSAVLQTVSNVLDFGRSIEEAVQSPRIHAENGTVNIEAGFLPEEAKQIVLADGWKTELWSKKNMFFGGVNAVAHDGKGHYSGAADNRRFGAVAQG